MDKLFENNNFRLYTTGHDYDFVGIIETKTDKPLTFFFSEELVSHEENEEEDLDGCDWEDNIDESETRLLDVYEGLNEYNKETDIDEEQDKAARLYADSYFRTRDDRSTGFLSDPRERGQFLAIIKHYCPEQLSQIAWA